MNDVKLSLDALASIQTEARREDRSFAEKAGLYAAMKAVCDEFRTHVDEKREGDGYAREKAARFEWHTAAMMGFDVANGNDRSTHLG